MCAAPKGQFRGEKSATYIWNDASSTWEAWDGVLNTGDIEIGAVELKDGDSDTRADIELDSAKNALFVQTETMALAANQLPDGHNVTVDNAAGASAVNIQDGGNSITVDAVDLDIRDLTSASDSVEVLQATASNLNATVVATDLDIRDLTSVSDSVECIQDTAADLNMTEASAASILIGVQALSGASTNGSTTLTGANTWVQVPTAAPASDYVLVVSKETNTGTIRWSFENGGTPGTTNGNKMTSDDIIFHLAASEVVYFGSTAATDVVNWATKIA